MDALVKSPHVLHKAASPYHRLDSVWMSRVRRSGWQGWTLLAGGDDVMDQSILFWQEGRGTGRCLCLSLRVRQNCDRKVRDHLTLLPGLDVYRGSIPYPRKQIVAGEVHPLDRQWSLMAGTALDAQVDANVRVRYLPYESEDVTPYSAQGCLTMVMENASGQIDEVTAMLLVLSHRLGIDTRLSTAADLEYLYLRKIAWAMRIEYDQNELASASIDANPQARGLQRLQTMQALVSRALGVERVTELQGYDWQPHFHSAYNPWTGAIGTGEAGWPQWYRFDVATALDGSLGGCFLGHDLLAQGPNVGDAIARLIRSTGHLLSAEERWMRLGTPSQSIHMPHGQWGGGAYLPLRLLRDDDSSVTLVFDIRLLRRVDHIALQDVEGALSPVTLNERLTLEEIERANRCDVHFKRAISLMDSLVRINVDQPIDRTKILDAFRTLGVEHCHGTAVEDLVRVR